MRITDNMITYNFLNSLNSSLKRQNSIQEKLADGKNLHRPSDDPVKAVRSLTFNTNLSMNDQYTQNVNDAVSWMNTTDGVLSNMSSIMIRAKELAVSADGTKTPDDLKAMASEVDGLINSLVDMGNTQVGNRYVFAGQKDSVQPFTRSGDTVTYNGDNGKISMVTKAGPVNPAQDGINLTGLDVFGAGTNQPQILNDMIKFKNDLMNADSTSITADIGVIDADHSSILQAQTELGVRNSMYQMTQSFLESQNTTITGDLSNNDDLDIPKAIMDFQNSQNVYKMALSVGARIMPPSLADFLK